MWSVLGSQDSRIAFTFAGLGVAMGRIRSGSSQVDEKSFDKRIESGQPIYGTAQKIIKPKSTHL